ncbi:unnamed protein product [Vicia faba]|uniref:Uncharacterized protein n=1 Tax=Vicia faba TaxID=3906 RepID=A0AAV0ZQ71_VICFA|nr:unnamed protein product [Vicia faba]
MFFSEPYDEDLTAINTLTVLRIFYFYCSSFFRTYNEGRRRVLEDVRTFQFPFISYSILEQRTGFRGFFWKAARVGERLSPWLCLRLLNRGIHSIALLQFCMLHSLQIYNTQCSGICGMCLLFP